MKNVALALLLLLLPAMAVAQNATYDGFYLDNGELVWEGVYLSDLPADGVRDALFEKLGTTDGVQLANYQPKDKIIGKAESRGNTGGLGIPAYTLSYGFSIAPLEDGYWVKVTNLQQAGTSNIKYPVVKVFPNEKRLQSGLRDGKVQKYANRLWPIFQIEGAQIEREQAGR